MIASQVFLYGHEAYHHNVESFATRLETSHRTPLYKEGFQRIYQDTVEHPEKCSKPYGPGEETLAVAYGILKARNLFRQEKSKQLAVVNALKSYIKECPPCYSRGNEYIKTGGFKIGQCDFAERNHIESISRPSKNLKIWLVFPHAFSGIGRITSRINYIVHRDSPIALRNQLHLRYIRYPELQKKLKELANCIFVRQGKGGHEIWKGPDGKNFPVPRHSGELNNKGVLKSILKQAGLNMSVSKFLQTKV